MTKQDQKTEIRQQLPASGERMGSKTAFSRAWAMPNADTFSIPPIKEFVKKYLENSQISIDPFARNSKLCTYRNDLNPNTKATYHLDAREFLSFLKNSNIRADLAIIDPPYSVRQIKEVYNNVGKNFNQSDSQNCGNWTIEKNLINKLVKIGGVVLSFGWNSIGMGRKRGYELIEIMMVCHGRAHNDTICIAERKLHEKLTLF